MFALIRRLFISWLHSFRAESVQQKGATDLAQQSQCERLSEGLASETQAEIQKEIRAERKFSLAEAIGREGGPFMKGDAAIPRPLKAKTEINQFVTNHMREPTGALATSLYDWASNDIRVSRQLDTPLIALAQIVVGILSDPTTFCEFARQVAIAGAKLTGDRPYFQLYEQAAHPEAEYTHDSIRSELVGLQEKLLKHLEGLGQPEFDQLKASLKPQ